MEATTNSLPTSPTRQLISIGDASKRFSIHPNTIRAACNRGELRCYRINLTGHRRLSELDVLAWLGVDKVDESSNLITRKTIIYARVSSNKQSRGISKGSESNDLARQIERLNKVARSSCNYSSDNLLIYMDTGSGLSFNRKGFVKLLDDILAGKLNGSILLVAYKDRLARFGHEIVERICGAFDISVQYTETDENEDAQKELSDDLLSIITHFSARTYGQRAAKRNAENIPAEAVSLANRLHKSGLPVSQVVSILNERGFRTEKGSGISRHVLSKYLNNELVEQVVNSGESGQIEDNSFVQFHHDYMVRVEEKIDPKTGKADKSCRLLKKTMIESYIKYCDDKRLIKLSAKHIGKIMKKELGYETRLNNDALTTYMGVGLKNK